MEIRARLEGTDHLIRRLRGISEGVDVRPLLKDVATILEDDNRRGILAGEDAQGRPMDPVRPYRGRPGSGPPLAPRGAASRVITDFWARMTGGRKNGRVEAGWDIPWLRFHRGTRDIVGIRPTALRAISNLVRRWRKTLVR